MEFWDQPLHVLFVKLDSSLIEQINAKPVELIVQIVRTLLVSAQPAKQIISSVQQIPKFVTL